MATLISVLKVAEADAGILNRQLTYDGSFDENKTENIKPQKSLEPGVTYSVDELLTYLIAYSDNNACHLIHEVLDDKVLLEVYSDLGLPVPPQSANGLTVDYMSAKSYSFMFRVLFSSTYLSRAMSEKALELLTTPDFPQGIEAGVPKNITTAQKFGERGVVSPTGQLLSAELHDCGIIYYPSHPYLLCIMTKGAKFDDLTRLIRDLSTLVYHDIDSKYK